MSYVLEAVFFYKYFLVTLPFFQVQHHWICRKKRHNFRQWTINQINKVSKVIPWYQGTADTLKHRLESNTVTQTRLQCGNANLSPIWQRKPASKWQRKPVSNAATPTRLQVGTQTCLQVATQTCLQIKTAGVPQAPLKQKSPSLALEKLRAQRAIFLDKVY